jgi:hypothetical protein
VKPECVAGTVLGDALATGFFGMWQTGSVVPQFM